MKKAIENIAQSPRTLLLGLLLLCNVLTAYGQFQTQIGAPYPIAEGSPGGIITPSGEFLILGENFDLSNPTGGDMQLDWLDNSGNFLTASSELLLPGIENAGWIEKNVFCSGNHYVIAGADQDNILVTMTDLLGTPIWTRSIGSPNDIESSVWVEMDPNGLIEVVGNKYDPNTGLSSVAMAQLDCGGTDNWRNTFSVNGYSLTAFSATTFPSFPGGLGICYITGKASPIAGGNDQLFIMRVNTSGGTPSFVKIYDVAPNSDDVGTCIQGSALFSPTGGELWVSGYSTDINALKNALLMKTDLNGNVLWANNYDVQGGDEFFNHFEFAANGKLVLTGKLLESTVFQSTKGGDCLLMRMDAQTGTSIDWTRGFNNNNFTSQGNRLEVTANDEYFVTGRSLELLSPSQSAGNILAIKTDPQGQTANGCYYNTVTQIIARTPIVSTFQPPSFTLGQMANNSPKSIMPASFNDQKTACSAPPPAWDCDFTWTNTGCFTGFFTATCMPAYLGNYKYEWDYDCGGPLPPIISFGLNSNPTATSFNQIFPYTFPCGGGTFQICLKVTDPFGTVCNIVHTITVPNNCCGSVSGNLSCNPTTPYKYDFTINVTNPLGSMACNHLLTSPYPLSNVLYSGNTITGCVAVTDPIPLGLNFTLQTNCTCISTGLPITCTLPFTLATVCCKKICVDDQTACEGVDEFLVPFYACNWPPVNMVYQVSWYVMPKPASGICPTVPWGGQPYQSTVVSNTLQALLLFPNILPGDLCVYVVVDLNDGPCTQITSNIAMVQLCKPNSCTINGQSHCYTGSCIPPNPLILTSTATQPTCFATVEWFDPAGNSVQIGGSSYQPPCLSMVNDQNCYEDFIYTAVITDDCGQHKCTGTIRLSSANAPVGTLLMTPSEPNPVCFAEDISVKFTPTCVGEPPQWSWYERDCLGNVSPVQGSGTLNNCLNLNELHNTAWYGVSAMNGSCPPTGVEMLIEVIEPAVIFNFDATADPCAEVQVVLSASVTPGTISCTGATFPCTYTYEWYKDGFLIGTTPNGSASESFTYLNPFPGPPPTSMAGNYYAIIREDCCPRNSIPTWVIPIRAACEPVIMGPCFICDFQPEVFMVQMVLPPNIQCPDACTFVWYTGVIDGSGNCVPGVVISTLPTVTISTPGQYFLESTCNGCVKLVKFDVLGCTSQQGFGQMSCGVISVEDLMRKDESPLNIFPNPTTGEITIEWSGQAPKNARIFITDPMGRRLRMLRVPDGGSSLTTDINDMPSGLYFVKVQSVDRLFNVAKLVKE